MKINIYIKIEGEECQNKIYIPTKAEYVRIDNKTVNNTLQNSFYYLINSFELCCSIFETFDNGYSGIVGRNSRLGLA